MSKLPITFLSRLTCLTGLYFLFCPLQSWAAACDVIFSNGIQATSPTGNINLSFQSTITGGGTTFKTISLTDNTGLNACGGSSCAASGTAAATATPTFVTGTGTNGAIAVANSGTASRASGDYLTVTVGTSGTLTFSSANGTYRTRAFTTNTSAILRLQSGDYWINGNLSLAQATILRRIATSGTTRIFVNGNITLGDGVTTDSFTSGQLLIYATGSITAGNSNDLSAYIYGGGNVSFGTSSIIDGGISGANFISSGNQITVNYQPSALATANFSPLCSGTTTTPTLLGSWHMDEASWNGTASEVKDTSGNNRHGRARIASGASALPSTASVPPAYSSGNQSTCRYGAFDGTGGSPLRNSTYVELSGFPTLPNGFTFAAWIRSTNPSAQHQRILVRDDADNGWGLSLADGTGAPELRFFARQITNSGAVTGQGINPNCGVFCLDTNPIIAANTWYYVAAVVDTSAKTVTLYVYNNSGVLQARTSGGYAGTWSDGTGIAAIGGETSASAEGITSSFHFLGNIDEVDIYSGALSQTNIETLLTTVRTCSGIDHYELQVLSGSVACVGTDVIVRACASSAVPCTQDTTINSNVTLATSAGTLSATTLTLASGAATTRLKHAAAADGANVVVTLSGEQTTAINSRKCCTGASSCSVADSCTTQFKTEGFVFSSSATGIGSIANQIAGVTNNNVYLRALKTDNTTGTCKARFTTPQLIPLAYQCQNPTTCIAGEVLRLNGTAVQSNANTASPFAYSNVSLAFDVNGSAAIPFNYSDVGQLGLLASLTLPATTNDPQYTMTGISNSFVVKPSDLVITSVQTIGNVNNPGTTQAGIGFVAAGTAFKVGVEARSAATSPVHITPNYGREITPESIELLINGVVNPVGGNSGTLTNTSAFVLSATRGHFDNTTISWSEVGTVAFKAHVTGSDYLGAGDVNSVAAVNVGRFYPDHFTLMNSSTQNSCAAGSFSYMGQAAISLSYSLQAENANNVLVSNYGPGYAPSANLAQPNYVAENADNGTSLSSRVSVPASGVWSAGIFNFTTSNAAFNRQVSGAPDGPYNLLQLGMGVNEILDNRGLKIGSFNINVSAAGCGAGCNAISLGSTLAMRYGRLRLDDAFGPESVALPVNFSTEYWTGNFFALSVNDSCTIVPRAAITYSWGASSGGSLVTDTNRTVSLSGGTTQGIYNNLDAAGVHFNAGTAGQYFSKPVAAGTGEFTVGINLTALAWLAYDWNQDSNYADTTMPNARFSFGSYRGNDRIIYWREKLQ